jgi:hypothetical protein
MAIVARQRKSGVVYYVNFFADGREQWEKCGNDRREAERLEQRRPLSANVRETSASS